MIFYLTLDSTLMAVDVIDSQRALLGPPRRLFTLPIESLSLGRNHYEIGPDGKHLLVVEDVRSNDPLAISVLTNWRQTTP